jgi:hypothetical protein
VLLLGRGPGRPLALHQPPPDHQRISEGAWAPEPHVFTLCNDESRWHRSWSADPAHPPALDALLAQAHSYGFSLVGFGQEPRGKFSMDEFEIWLAGE